ncbi:CU044_2847 family protein [Streptomyces sp. NPDC020141]|uniref:CU044_2847 family protein n=1 Tax=Streptomyces sp. NPDC020141 TaxID=3365065 RepID=UPI003793FBFC
MDGRVRRIELPGGAVVHARLSSPGGGYGEDDEDVGFADRAAARVRQLEELIGGVGASVLAAAAAARPDEASVSFGVELTMKSGAALAVLAAGEAKASVQVTLVWRLGDQPVCALHGPFPAPPAVPPPAPPAPADPPSAPASPADPPSAPASPPSAPVGPPASPPSSPPAVPPAVPPVPPAPPAP